MYVGTPVNFATKAMTFFLTVARITKSFAGQHLDDSNARWWQGWLMGFQVDGFSLSVPRWGEGSDGDCGRWALSHHSNNPRLDPPRSAHLPENPFYRPYAGPVSPTK